MGKILILSTALILLILGANFFWPSIMQVKANPQKGLGVTQAVRAIQSLPDRLKAGIDTQVKEVQKNLARQMMEKTSGEIVGLLENLPPQQQEVIKKDYCGE